MIWTDEARLQVIEKICLELFIDESDLSAREAFRMIYYLSNKSSGFFSVNMDKYQKYIQELEKSK